MATAPGMYPHQLIYSYLHPKPDVITAAQKTYIDGHIAAFESAMKAARLRQPHHRVPQLDRRQQLERFFHPRPR